MTVCFDYLTLCACLVVASGLAAAFCLWYGFQLGREFR